MSTGAKYTICISVGIVAELVALWFAMWASFSGHGHASLPGAFSFVFPLTFIISPRADAEGFRATFEGMTSMLQMPVYGWILARGWTHKAFLRTALVLASVHFIAALVGLFLRARA